MHISKLTSLIGVSGYIGAGKDAFSDILAEKHGYTKIPLAKALKVRAQYEFDLTDEQLHGGLKDVVDSRYGVTPRYIMQQMGTEWYRSIDPNFWIRKLAENISGFLDFGECEPALRRVVVSDVRYKNEAVWIRRNGGVMVRVVRPGVQHDDRQDARQHISENSLDVNDCDYVALNTGTLKDLEEQAEIVMRGAYADGLTPAPWR